MKILASIVMVMLLLSCSEQKKEIHIEESVKQGELSILMLDSKQLREYAAFCCEFEYKHGFLCDFTFVSADSLHAHLSANFYYGSSCYDLVIFDCSWLEEIGDDLLDVDELLGQKETNELMLQYPSYLQDAPRLNTKLKGLPLSFDMPILYYREDLFHSLNISVPQNWAELYNTAIIVSARSNMHGLALNQSDFGSVALFLSIASGMSNDFVYEDLANIRAHIGAEPFFSYLGLTKLDRQARLDHSLTETEPLAAFSEGKSAMLIAPWSEYKSLQRKIQSARRGGAKIGYASLPIGKAGRLQTPCTVYALGLTKMSSNKKYAAQFLRWMSDPAIELLTIDRTMFSENIMAVHTATLTNSELKKRYRGIHEFGLKELRAALPQARLKNWQKIKEVLARLLFALEDEKDFDTAIGAAQEDIERQFR